ncbi:MAG: oligosaccharide flippase family protein [Alphaproteobacteria bacterium]|nr:oligosaccharide flippase family protein [Alphaproteobacteria bacterium]
MLFRHIIGYAPSLLVPAVTAFLAVFAYTRLLSPSEYGHYALALNSMTLVNAIFFFWLQVSLPRLMPQAIRQKNDDAFRTTAYAAYAAVSAVILIIGVPIVCLYPFGEFKAVANVTIPLALARSILNLNQSFHRSRLDFNRYNIIECGQAVIGLASGLCLVWFARLESFGANVGMVLGMACMLIVDIKTMMKTSWRDFDPAILKEIVLFGAPLVAGDAIGFLISSSDRYLIGYFHGAAEVGIYAAGYAVVDRIITMLFMAIATPAFPLVVQRLEHEGIAAAQQQMRRNGLAVLFLVLPACAGLLIANKELAYVLVGPEFRESAIRMAPWVVGASALNGLATHYVCHAMHLAKRPNILFWIQIPVAALNLALNFFLIPQFGYMGAAYASFASYALLLVLNIWTGIKAFPFDFPFKEVVQISICVALMALGISFFSFPLNTLGLVEKVAMGSLIYLVSILALDVMGARSGLLAFAARARRTTKNMKNI